MNTIIVRTMDGPHTRGELLDQKRVLRDRLLSLPFSDEREPIEAEIRRIDGLLAAKDRMRTL